MKYNTSPNEAKIWGVHGAMDAMPDYNTSSPAGMELAQLTEVVSCNTTVKQDAAVQMQIQSVHDWTMLRNIPITTDKDFIIILFIYSLDSTKIVCTLEVSHTERKDS